MTAPLHHQRFRDQRYQMLNGNTQPKLIIFAHRDRFIEAADLLEQRLRHHHRRRTHQTKIKATGKYVARKFLVLCLRIDSAAITNPNFFALADLNFRMSFHESGLNFQLFGPPKVVGIEKGDIAPDRSADAEITRGSHASSGFSEQSYPRTKFCQFFLRRIRRTIVDDDELEVSVDLCEDRFDGFPDHGPAVEGGNDDAYDGRHDATRALDIS